MNERKHFRTIYGRNHASRHGYVRLDNLLVNSAILYNADHKAIGLEPEPPSAEHALEFSPTDGCTQVD